MILFVYLLIFALASWAGQKHLCEPSPVEMEAGRTSGPAQILPTGLEGLLTIAILVLKATFGRVFGKNRVSVQVYDPVRTFSFF